VKEITMEMKNIKAAGCDLIPAKAQIVVVATDEGI
jgi:hypothetical protein